MGWRVTCTHMWGHLIDGVEDTHMGSDSRGGGGSHILQVHAWRVAMAHETSEDSWYHFGHEIVHVTHQDQQSSVLGGWVLS